MRSKVLLTLLLFIFLFTGINGQNLTQLQKILPTDGSANNYFGHSAAMDGNFAVIGAFQSGDAIAYVYQFNTDSSKWLFMKKLIGSDAAIDGWPITNVAISGTRIVVGASDDNTKGTDAGAAFIFEKDQGGVDNWGLVKKITASNGKSNARFGWSVAIYDTTIVVGDPWEDSKGFNSGAIYIYNENNGGLKSWGQIKMIFASDLQSNDNYGFSVAIDDSLIAVGSISDDDLATDAGAGYLYARDNGGKDNWGLVKKLKASDGTGNARFGFSVDVTKNRVVFGSIGNSAAYLYEKDFTGTNNWGERKKFSYKGSALSLDESQVLIGDYNNKSNAGTAYLFSKDEGGVDNWGIVKEIFPNDSVPGDMFGMGIAVQDDKMMIGGHKNDDNGSESGSAYFFGLIPSEPSAFVSSNLAKNSVDLNWTDNSNNETAFILQRSSGSDNNYVTIASLGANTTSYTDNSLEENTLYFYRLFAKNSLGSSEAVELFITSPSHLPGNIVEMQKILASDGATNDRFSYTVSISGKTAVLGAGWDDDKGTDSGSAYIFEFNPDSSKWIFIKKLTASDGGTGDEYGRSVAISGDYIVVGQINDDDSGGDSGAAYVYERNNGGDNNWGQIKKLKANDAALFDHFGWAVSISGNHILVGSRDDDDKGSGSGSAYVFNKNHGGNNNWGQVKKLTASDGAADDWFGYSLSISGNNIIIGAYRNDDGGNASGSAYIFNKDHGAVDNWGEVKKLRASDESADDNFGYAVSISENTAIVGSYLWDNKDGDEGAAYIFEKDHGGANNWGEAKKIIAADGAHKDYFGITVSISGDLAVIGAYFDDDKGTNSGSAYIYSRNEGGSNNWGEFKKLTASDGNTNLGFAWSVSVSGNIVLVGDYIDNVNGTESGSAYFFTEDNTAPVAPANLSGVAGDGEITINWNSNAEADFSKYYIYYGTTANPGIRKDSVSNIAVTSKKISSLTNYVNYYFRITAIDTNGNESTFSNEISIQAIDLTAPAEIQNPFLSNNDLNVTFQWAKSSEPDFEKYYIYFGSDLKNIPKIDSVFTQADTSITFNKLTNGVKYYARVSAVDTSGNEGDKSSIVDITPVNMAPSSPTGLSGTLGDSQVTLNWNANNENDFSKYYIYVDTTSSPSVIRDSVLNISTTSHVVSNLLNYKKYFFRITALDTNGNESTFSNEISITPIDMTVPSAPKTLLAVAGDKAVELSWEKNSESDFSKYYVYGGINSKPVSRLDSIKNISDTSTTITNLTNYQQYYFRLTAVDVNGNESSFSNEVTATPTDKSVPTAPKNLRAEEGDGQVRLIWSKNIESDFSKYYIYGDNKPGPSTKIDSISSISDTSLVVKNLSNYIRYYYRVTAVDTNGNESSYSNEVNAEPKDLTAPAIPSAFKAKAGDATITLSWSANKESDFAGYILFAGSEIDPVKSIDTIKTVTDTSKVISGLENYKRYHYRIKAYDIKGNESGYSENISAMPIDLTKPELKAEALFPSVKGVDNYLTIYLYANESLKSLPLAVIETEKTKENKKFSVFLEAKNIYQLKYKVEDFGDVSFHIIASDLNSNFNSVDINMNVQRLKQGKRKSFTLGEKLTVSFNGKSFSEDAFIYSKEIELNSPVFLSSDGDEIEKISPVYQLFSHSKLKNSFSYNYDLTYLSKSEEDKRKIGLYRYDENRGNWTYIGGSAKEKSIGAIVNEFGTIAVFYNPKQKSLPETFRLEQNYPNPFNPVTTIAYSLPQNSYVILKVYNILGQELVTLVNGYKEAGFNHVQWNGLNKSGVKAASGIYIYKISFGNKVISKKMVLLK